MRFVLRPAIFLLSLSAALGAPSLTVLDFGSAGRLVLEKSDFAPLGQPLPRAGTTLSQVQSEDTLLVTDYPGAEDIDDYCLDEIDAALNLKTAPDTLLYQSSLSRRAIDLPSGYKRGPPA